MVRTKGNSKGLRDIRTHSGKVDRLAIPHMAYMNISCLEMEKARREKERLSALNRINNIDQRLQEIEAEKDVLLKGLGERTGELLKKAPSSRETNTPAKSGFKIRY
jgi:hypothetical protein